MYKDAMRVVLSFRVDSKLKEALERLARAENRSLANYVANVLLRHVMSHGIEFDEDPVPPSRQPRDRSR